MAAPPESSGPESITPDALAARLLRQVAARSSRLIVAIAGPPCAGKSTLVDALQSEINNIKTNTCAVLSMDAFHYDDTYLTPMGWQNRKGAPHTFDVGGLLSCLARLRQNTEAEIAVPVFDRKLEIARAGARMIAQDAQIILVEGNYLLLNTAPWTGLRKYYDLTIMLDVAPEIINARLHDRWAGFGFSKAEAEQKIAQNDLLNAALVRDQSSAADLYIRTAF